MRLLNLFSALFTLLGATLIFFTYPWPHPSEPPSFAGATVYIYDDKLEVSYTDASARGSLQRAIHIANRSKRSCKLEWSPAGLVGAQEDYLVPQAQVGLYAIPAVVYQLRSCDMSATIDLSQYQ